MSEEEEPEGSAAAGGFLLLAAGIGTGVAVYAISRDLLVILVWVIGSLMIWRAIRRGPKSVQDAPDPAPPPPSEGVAEENTQVTMIRDVSHPNRWVVARSSRWMQSSINRKS